MVDVLALSRELAVAAVIGAASGAIGSFVLIRRMALAGDALSHVALPGIALAIAYRVDPFWGVLLTLVVAAFLIWWLELQSRLPTDSLVGVLFTSSLAIGVLTIPDTELFESLFGAFPALSPLQFGLTLGGTLFMLALTMVFARRFLFSIVSEDLAHIAGVGRGSELLLLLVFSVIVALGIKLVGTLLMGALTIIPAAVARNVTFSMRSYMLAAMAIGAFIAAAGAALAERWSIHPGPAIILVGAALFVLSLMMPRLLQRR